MLGGMVLDIDLPLAPKEKYSFYPECLGDIAVSGITCWNEGLGSTVVVWFWILISPWHPRRNIYFILSAWGISPSKVLLARVEVQGILICLGRSRRKIGI